MYVKVKQTIKLLLNFFLSNLNKAPGDGRKIPVLPPDQGANRHSISAGAYVLLRA
jgi:hypothetical protein